MIKDQPVQGSYVRRRVPRPGIPNPALLVLEVKGSVLITQLGEVAAAAFLVVEEPLPPSKRPYTREEKQYIARNAGVLEDEAMAVALGRTFRAVQAERERMGYKVFKRGPITSRIEPVLLPPEPQPKPPRSPIVSDAWLKKKTRQLLKQPPHT